MVQFAVLSVRAIKEQQQEIDQQKIAIEDQQKKLDAQENAIQIMRDEMAQLKKMMVQIADKK